MRLSESLRRNILQTGVGGITNRFKGKSRRTILFFEDILAGYIKECERAGHSAEMEEIGKLWSTIGAEGLLPSKLKILPFKIKFMLMRRVWMTMGILEDLKITSKDGTHRLVVEQDTITRIIGKSEFVKGSYDGLFSSLLGRDVECISCMQGKERSDYVFRETGKIQQRMEFNLRDKEAYNRLNLLPKQPGMTLKDALRKRILQIKGNRLFFRGRSLCSPENTLFHILGARKIKPECISTLSYEYFKDIIDTKQGGEKMLHTIKNLLQVMGWGLVVFVKDQKKLKVSIKNPPYGLIEDGDDWSFIVRVILGYVWLLDRKYRLESFGSEDGNLKIYFTLG